MKSLTAICPPLRLPNIAEKRQLAEGQQTPKPEDNKVIDIGAVRKAELAAAPEDGGGSTETAAQDAAPGTFRTNRFAVHPGDSNAVEMDTVRDGK